MATILRKKSNKWIKNNLNGKHFDVVLNLGCGDDTDKQGNYYSNYFKSKKCIMIDNLDETSKKKHLDFIAGAEDLPLENNSIDYSFHTECV